MEDLRAIIKALRHKDIKSSLAWDDQDTAISKTITKVLEPARVATEGLSNASINLLVSEGILKFLVTEMDEKFQLAFHKKPSGTARQKSE